MSTVTVQQIGNDLLGWLAAVQRGDTVAIVDAGREIARLVPPDREASAVPTSDVHWPDFAARRRSIFGDKLLPAGTAQTLIDEDRGE
jgi:antitoxin (DNA-binding transcriptional repressor) of toxin-antitoxin stability system